MAENKFIRRTIAPAGRNKYGHYYSSGDITKSVTMATYAGNSTTTTLADTGSQEEDLSKVNFYCMLLQTTCTFNETELNNNPSASTRILAYKGYDVAPTIMCDIDSIGATVVSGGIVSVAGVPVFDMPADSGITGLPTGISVHTVDNGTSASTIVFTASSELAGQSANTGSIMIPVTVYKRDDDLPEPTLQSWYDHAYQVSGETGLVRTNYCETVWLEFVWNLNRRANSGGDGESAYYLTLDNDNASINADANGNIYSGAVRPTCHAKLYYGSSPVTNAKYRVNYGGASGITSATSSSGVLTLTFGSDFNFTADTVHITVSGMTSSGSVNTVRDVKIMNVTKSKAGANGADGVSGASGQDAVSYWLEPSFNEVIYDRNTQTFTPSAITCSAYTQVGGNQPSAVTNANIYYKWQSREDGTWRSTEYIYSNKINITSALCVSNQRLRLILKVGDDPNTAQIKDQEDIDILMDGLNGSQGLRGERGAAIRGPYDYYAVSGDNRCWCNGEETMYCDDCKNWIDIIYKDGNYYRCVSGYNGTLTTHFPAYWESGTSYDFVATRVLLAENAKINFLTNNELYLMDENGNVTGGARGGSGITFWAGGDITGVTSGLPFRVMTDGTLYAKTGIFAGYIQMPYKFIESLNRDNKDGYIADERAYLIADNLLRPYKYNSNTNITPYLILPEPCEELNGFTYHIVLYPDYATRGSAQLAILSVVTSARSESFYVAAFAADDEIAGTMWKKMEFYAGHVEITCMPKRNSFGVSYYWAVTMCTAGITLYNNSDELEIKGAYGPIMGYSPTDNMYVPVKLQTDNNPSSNRMRNTIYITP